MLDTTMEYTFEISIQIPETAPNYFGYIMSRNYISEAGIFP